ncbi:hypothetical protein N7448_010144 [Penicillium atrosanguineum]|nr:uncharacterized protein N7443_007366 [Penicillium atrosanguineum]KAJ5119475.1 hypothetical protein N7448_010144 [Penicillium atrosanguineum]KAJ5296473.1 hypothetical protein N7443_007366 [Penicillium atrosanguineum]
MPGPTRGSPGCLLCKARKVRCDKAQGPCMQCSRMRLECPGLGDEEVTSQELHSIVDDAFQHAGRRRRVVGACQECQVAKIRCSREKPRCQSCISRALGCVYSGDRVKRRRVDREVVQKSPSSPWQLQPVTRENEWMASLSLPDDTNKIRQLVEAYFMHIHPLRCLSFIHKPSFMHAIDNGEATEEFGEALLYIMCAFGSRYYNFSASAIQTGNQDLGTGWVERAQELAFIKLGKPSVSNLMALVLLCEWHIRFGQESTAFTISGIASRLAQLLRLDSEPTPESLTGIPMALVTAEKEARRRLVWSCYNLDVHISSGVDLISSWPSVPKTHLPCSGREFNLQIECETGTLREGPEFLDGLNKTTSLSLEAYFVYIMYLRKQVLSVIRKEGNDAVPEFDKLVSTLEKCGESFPRHLQLNEMNAYVHEENHQLSAFYALHLLYNQCFCDLYRIALPGYRFPLSSALIKSRPDSMRSLQSECVGRAQKLTGILQSALNRGLKAFTDSVMSDSTSVSKNIDINLASLDVILGRSKKRDALFSSLSKLLQEFGFLELANQWLERNKMSFPGSHTREDSSPETHHLHPLANYRMTWKEISWPQKANGNTEIPVSQATNFLVIEDYAREKSMDPALAAMPSDEYSLDINDLTSMGDTFMPDIDSYLQMADEFSSYLTWDPWNFGIA